MYQTMEPDLADDELKRIISMKEDLVELIDNVKKHFASINSSTDIDVIYWENLQEEQFDDLFHKEWHRLTYVSGSVEWTREIPSCDTLRAQVAKRRKA